MRPIAGRAVEAFAPGRVNLIGEHTDTSGGYVLPAALVQGVTVRAAASGSASSVVRSRGSDATFRAVSVEPGEPLGWARYPAGVAWALRQAGLPVVEIEAEVTSDLPSGAGLSSSAALTAAFATAWCGLSGLEPDRRTLARACQQAEHAFVGVECGLMDPMASLFGEDGRAVLIDTSELVVRPVSWPDGWAIVVCDTGRRRSLAANSQYNDRRRDVERVMQALETPSLRDVTPDRVAHLSGRLGERATRRGLHVAEENARVLGFVRAVEDGDAATVGRLMRQSHESLRNLFEVTTIELDGMVASALASPGCIGARMTGAGFGGSVVAVVERAQADEFISAVEASYRRGSYGCQPAFLTTRPGAGARLGRRSPA